MDRFPPTMTTAPLSCASQSAPSSNRFQWSTQRYECRAGGCGAWVSIQRTRAAAGVEEAVGRADAREYHVTGADRVGLAVELGLDLPVEEEVRLLERMVVDLRRAAGLVVDGEHREQLGADDPVDEHLHADAAVHDQRGVSARGPPPTGGVGERQRLGLRRRAVVVADLAQPRIAERRPRGDRRRGRRDRTARWRRTCRAGRRPAGGGGAYSPTAIGPGRFRHFRARARHRAG